MHDVVPGEWPVTLESDPELRLDELLPHLNFRAFYERIANSEGQGELDLTELSKRLKRHNPTRTIVGEVRGAEAITMLEAMSAGADGGWSTMHANSAAAVFPASTPTRPARKATGPESTSTSWPPRRSMSSCSSASCLTAAGSSRDLPRRVLRPVDEPDGHR